MSLSAGNESIRFFDSQFHRQIEAGDYALNPFERAALPFLRDEVLDLGCGLGNLALAAARQAVASYLEGKTVVKEIVVPGKLVNFVVK